MMGTIFALLLASGAAAQGTQTASAPARAAASPSVPATAPAYRIGRGDILAIAVLGQDGLGGEFQVDGEGMLAFPFVGRVKADQYSTVELEKKLTSLLSDGYLKRPQVAVAVKEYRSQRVFVSGEVQNPGAYGLRPDHSLIGLLHQVGPLTANVGHEVVVIRPPTGAAAAPAGDDPPSPAGATAYPGQVPGAEILHANLRELRSGYPDRDIQLRPGDTVYLPRAAQVYVTGHVARPGAFRYEEGLTVFQLLALAGGATDRGAEKRARIARVQDGKKQDLRAKPTDPVLPEDVLHVPERFF